MQAFAKFAGAIKTPAAGFSAMFTSGDVFSARPRVHKSIQGKGEKLSP